MVYQFALIEWMMLALCIILCVAALLYFRHRFRHNQSVTPGQSKTRLVLTVSGLIVILASVFFHVKAYSDIVSTEKMFRALAELASRPLLMITIMTFIVGLTLFTLGLIPRNTGEQKVTRIPSQIFLD